ncbi:MAG: carbon-nitrogen hydrolase family protein [Bacteroidales bacterium]
MKLAAAQILPSKGDLSLNIGKHLDFISMAVKGGADLILFPELSLTSYESKRAKELACIPEDPRLEVFQQKSEEGNIIICAGLPTWHRDGIRISMLIFQPGKKMQVYSKRWLHADELPYFVPGEDTLLIEAGGKICAPAICYESTVMEHTLQAHQAGAAIYLASVADSASGLEKAYRHYPVIAKQFGMIVLLSNGLGPCDDFICKGRSAVWNGRGELMGQLGEEKEGLLIYDTETGRLAYHRRKENGGRPAGKRRSRFYPGCIMGHCEPCEAIC